jgi:hypothetical protein
MNYLELVNAVLREIDVPTVSTLSGATGMVKRVMGWVNQSISDLFMRSNDWMFREASGSFVAQPGETEYVLSEHVDLNGIKALYLQETKARLKYVDYENLRSSSVLGMPQRYSIFSNKIVLSPAPAQPFSVVYHFQASPVVLTEDSDTSTIPSLWDYTIVEGASYRAKVFLNDDDYRETLARYELGIKKMLSHNRGYLERRLGMSPEDDY